MGLQKGVGGLRRRRRRASKGVGASEGVASEGIVLSEAFNSLPLPSLPMPHHRSSPPSLVVFEARETPAAPEAAEVSHDNQESPNVHI